MNQNINLYAAHLRPVNVVVTGKKLGFVILFLMSSGLIGGSLWQAEADKMKNRADSAKSTLDIQQKAHDTLAKQMAERKVSPALAQELSMTRALLNTHKEVLEYLRSGQLGNTNGFSDVFKGFAKQAPTDLWLTYFAVAGGGIGQTIEVKGRMLSSNNLPAYVEKLGKEDVFSNRRFSMLEMNEKTNAPAANQGTQSAQAQAAASSLPARYIEFILRSENFAGAKK